MLSFGRVPVPFRAVRVRDSGELRVEEKGCAVVEVDEAGKQHRTRYYERLAVLPTSQPGLSRRSSQPLTGVAALPIPAAPASAAVSRFARSTQSSVHSSQSLPSEFRRSSPIDIPVARRSTGGTAGTSGAAAWYGRRWQAAADDTDGSGGSADSEDADCWYVGERRQMSDSFVDDSELQWSGRCLQDDSADVQTVGGRRQLARWNSRPQSSDSDEEDDDGEVEAGSVLPFPLLAPSYHVDFELN